MKSIEVDGRTMTYVRTSGGGTIGRARARLRRGRSLDVAATTRWSPDEFDVIACDLPGAGGPDDPPESLGMDGFAEALAGLISELALERPHLVGLSFGGATLIEFCRQHQDLASTITLVGAYAGWVGSLPDTE